MKQLQVKASDINKTGEEKWTTIDSIYYVLQYNSVKKGGTDEEQIWKNHKIRTVLKDYVEGTPVINFEDADFDEIKRQSEGVLWPADNIFFYEFRQELKNAKSVKALPVEDLEKELSKNGLHKVEADGNTH